jgi:hypothetical protein
MRVARSTHRHPARRHGAGRLFTAALGSLALAGGVAAGPAAAGPKGPGPAACADLPGLPYVVPTGASTITADIDGDGVDQPVALSSRPAGDRLAWDLVSAVGPDHRLVSTEIPDFSSIRGLYISGAGDVDGDGDDDIQIAGAGGASTDFVQVWGVRDCRWTPFTVGEDPAPTTFVVGASVMHTDGVRCVYGKQDVMLVHQSFRIGDSDRHDLTVRAFALSDLHATAVGPERTVQVTDAELGRDWPATFDCAAGRSRRPDHPGGTPVAPDAHDGGTAAATTTTTTVPTVTPAPAPAAPPHAVAVTPHYTG